MRFDTFLTVDGIDSESIDEKDTDWIDIASLAPARDSVK